MTCLSAGWWKSSKGDHQRSPGPLCSKPSLLISCLGILVGVSISQLWLNGIFYHHHFLGAIHIFLNCSHLEAFVSFSKVSRWVGFGCNSDFFSRRLNRFFFSCALRESLSHFKSPAQSIFKDFPFAKAEWLRKVDLFPLLAVALMLMLFLPRLL